MKKTEITLADVKKILEEIENKFPKSKAYPEDELIMVELYDTSITPSDISDILLNSAILNDWFSPFIDHFNYLEHDEWMGYAFMECRCWSQCFDFSRNVSNELYFGGCKLEGLAFIVPFEEV